MSEHNAHDDTEGVMDHIEAAVGPDPEIPGPGTAPDPEGEPPAPEEDPDDGEPPEEQ